MTLLSSHDDPETAAQFSELEFSSEEAIPPVIANNSTPKGDDQ